MSRLIVLFGTLLAGWPVLRWYVLRLQDGSDEPLGLVALAVALFFAPRAGWREPLARRRVVVLCVLVAVQGVAYFFLPALVRALIFVAMIGVVAAPPRSALGWTMLLVLALPVISTLQFYLGYPLRLPTTQLSAWLLQLGGIEAHASGTTLLWAGERVIVDAPCSGIQMAWAGAFAAAALACGLKLSWRNALRLFRWTGVIVFVANVVRCTALFLVGAGIWRLPDFAHEGIGLLLFAPTVGLIYLRSIHYAGASGGEGGQNEGADSLAVRPSSVRLQSHHAWRPALLFFGLCGVVAAGPVLTTAGTGGLHTVASGFPGWSVAPLPGGLHPLTLAVHKQQFARQFPGEIGVFSDGQKTWIVRWISSPSRRLHPAADCLRAMGYTVTSLPILAANDGTHWGVTTARRAGENLRVRERMVDAQGREFTDVSAWYWAAVLEKSVGPWWSVARLETDDRKR